MEVALASLVRVDLTEWISKCIFWEERLQQERNLIPVDGDGTRKVRAMTILIVLLAVSLGFFALGFAWTLTLRGHTTRRSGADVGVEYIEEEMARRDFRAGKTSLGRKAWFWGKGWAVEREAAVSYKELKTMWRKGSYGALLPMALLLGGFLTSILAGGVLLMIRLDNPIPGLVVLAFGIYGAWIVGSGIHRA